MNCKSTFEKHLVGHDMKFFKITGHIPLGRIFNIFEASIFGLDNNLQLPIKPDIVNRMWIE